MNNEKTARSNSNVATQILLSAIAGVLGYLLLFKPEIQLITLCRVLCGALIAVGLISIISFFVSEDFKRIDRFGFAVGVMLILIGVVGLLRVTELTASFETFAGVMALILGVLTLQGTVQMRALDYPVWVLNLVLSIVSLAGAFIILSKIEKIMGLIDGFPYWFLLINGISCLFSLLVTTICLMLAKRRATKAEKEKPKPEEQEPVYSYSPDPVPAPAPVYSPEPAAAPSYSTEVSGMNPAPSLDPAPAYGSDPGTSSPEEDYWKKPSDSEDINGTASE